MTKTKWSDNDFLNAMMNTSDKLADDVYMQMLESGSTSKTAFVFQLLKTNDSIDGNPALTYFPFLKDFLEATENIPADPDFERLERAGALLNLHAYPIAIALLCASMPEGFAAPSLSSILHMTGNLEKNPYQRLLGVLQLVLNVTAKNAFNPLGAAMISAQKLRLLHAGIRHICKNSDDPQLIEYKNEWGQYVNLEDKLATIMGFSVVVMESLTKMNINVTDQDKEDWFYLWRYYSLAMGIHPHLEPDNTVYVPDNYKQAQEFYAAYSKRHFKQAPHNPEGVILASYNQKMLEGFIPWWGTIFGLKKIPRIYMRELMGIEGCRRVLIKPVFGHFILKFLLFDLTKLLNDITGWKLFKNLHFSIGRFIFRSLIQANEHGQFTWMVPTDESSLDYFSQTNVTIFQSLSKKQIQKIPSNEST